MKTLVCGYLNLKHFNLHMTKEEQVELKQSINIECSLAFEEIINQKGLRFDCLKLSEIILDKSSKPTETKLKEGKTSLGIKLGSTGVYIFENPKGELVYIGQGGRNESTINSRILQELRLYKKTTSGNNAGTISKNIQDIDDIQFNEEMWKLYISNFKIRILHSNDWSISINLIEAFLIETIKPRYNKIK